MWNDKCFNKMINSIATKSWRHIEVGRTARWDSEWRAAAIIETIKKSRSQLELGRDLIRLALILFHSEIFVYFHLQISFFSIILYYLMLLRIEEIIMEFNRKQSDMVIWNNP